MSLKSINESFNRQFSEIDKSIKEDTIKQNGKWVNKGKEGTHGKFKTKKAADAQRKAMFANGYKAEALKENFPTHGNKIDLEKVIQVLWEKGNEIGGEDWIEVFNPNEISKLSSGEEYCNRIEVTGADGKQIKISLKTNGGNIEYQIFDEGRDWKKTSSVDELWKVIFDRVGRKTDESMRRKPMIESSEDKLVIYKSLGKYRVTPESNYNARVQNARKVQKLDDFESADEIIDYYVKYGWANGKDDFKVIEESKKITERNLNRAERHNRDMSNIFDRKKGYDRKFADFLKKNGYSDDEIERLRKSDSLSKEIANKFTPDGKQPSEILGKILKEADDVEYEKTYYSAKRPDGSGEIDYWEVERPKNPKDWGRGERNRTFLDRKEWQKRAFGINESKNLTESFDDMEVFMNTWANYNEYGADGVLTPTGWMSIDEAIEYCEEYADYEPFINDTDNVPFEINEYSNASSVLQDLKELQDSNVDEDVVEAIVEAGGYDVKEAVEIAERGDYYFYPDVHDYSDLAYAVIDEIGSLGDALGDRITNYIDEDQMRREYSWDVRDMMRDDAEYAVDEEHEGEDEDSYDREQEIEDWIDEHEDDYLDSIIDEEIRLAEAGEIDLSNYFDYEAFGRDLSYDGYTFTDKGAILIN